MPKLHFVGGQRELNTVLKIFLIEHCKGEEMDAIDASTKLIQRWGMRVDWHEFSYVLDELSRTGYTTVTQPGGMTKYIVNYKRETGTP